MITKITSIEELKQIFTESLLNNTDKVTKISDGSVLNGIGYGVAKIGQKILKDISLIESHQYPDIATGDILDNLAKLRGIAPRLGASSSTVYVRLIGEPGTIYNPNENVFTGEGQNFVLTKQEIIPEVGYTYVNLNSQNTGEITNVKPLTITKIYPIPTGHQYVINEFQATGGRDIENDDDFRKRIKDEPNVLARTTLSYLEQVFRKFEPSVLKVINIGLDYNGDIILAVVSVTGSNYTESQLSNMLLKGDEYLSLNELKPDGLNNYGIKLVNIQYFPIDISFRVDIDESYNYDIVRRYIQINMSKLLDFRYWKAGNWIDWIDLLNCAKNVKGVNRILDNYFYPNYQFPIPLGMLPRIRGFQMMDLKGNIITDLQGYLNPVYYPSVNDFAYQATILRSL